MPMKLPRGSIAIALGLGWTLLCAWLARGLIAGYFPLADEWSLLAAADPALTPASSWFTVGFSNYFEMHPEIMAPYTNFARPLFNGVYWLLGLVFAPDSGTRLLLNCLALGLMSALAWLAMTPDGVRHRSALLLALALPLLPALLPALVLMQPFMAFDPLTACLCLGSYIAWQRERFVLCLLLLAGALLMKETALPLAVALPLHALLERRSRQAALLALPLLAWILWRWLNFGSLSGGTYTIGAGAGEILRGILDKAQRWPLWVLRLPAGAGLFYKLSHALMVAANYAVVIGGSLLMLLRLLRNKNLDVAEWCMVFSYGLMLLTGVYARFGAVLDVFLVISIARWLREETVPLLPQAPAAALALGVMLYLLPTWQVMHSVPAQITQYQAVGRDYVAALGALPAGRRVLVLNDPVTWHSRLPALKAVAGVQADVAKLADFTCPNAMLSLDQPCTVELKELGGRRYEFSQSCGLSLCGTRRLPAQPVSVREDEARLDLPIPMNPASSNPSWDHYTLELDRGDLDLLYFDPSSRSFITRHVP